MQRSRHDNPRKRVSVAVATTFGKGSFDAQGNVVTNYSVSLCTQIGAILAPSDRPPTG